MNWDAISAIGQILGVLITFMVGCIAMLPYMRKCNCTSQQKLDTNFKYYLSINLISVQYGASFATFLSG